MTTVLGLVLGLLLCDLFHRPPADDVDWQSPLMRRWRR